MHYLDEGRGPVLLFVHGTPTWSFEFRHLVRALRARYRCIAPDHLGFGLSDRPAHLPYTPEAHAQVLGRFVDRLGLSNFTLVVHDFGGPIALPLALGAGRVERLVVLNSWMWSFADDPVIRRRARMLSGAFGRFLYRWLNLSLRVLLPSAYGDRRKLTPAIHLAAFCGDVAQPSALASREAGRRETGGTGQ
jgi:haloalkane dehalogenase